jgi:hypothetical protein
MKKLIWNTGATGAATAVAAGALLFGGGSAAAAVPGATGPTAAGATTGPAGQAEHRHHGLECIDPWVAGQLAMFDPAARHRLAAFDPWVKDQLARFASPSCETRSAPPHSLLRRDHFTNTMSGYLGDGPSSSRPLCPRSQWSK